MASARQATPQRKCTLAGADSWADAQRCSALQGCRCGRQTGLPGQAAQQSQASRNRCICKSYGDRTAGPAALAHMDVNLDGTMGSLTLEVPVQRGAEQAREPQPEALL